MKVAVIGSRTLTVQNLADYLPDGTDCIVSGGARGIDSCAADFARKHGMRLIEFKPDYEKFGRRAPLVRNIDIVNECDYVLAFWDGKSRGTKYTINRAEKRGKPVKIIIKQSR